MCIYHVPAVSASPPSQQVVKCGLVGLPCLERAGRARLPLPHRGEGGARVAHEHDARIAVDEGVKAAVISLIEIGVEAVRGGEQVRVLQAGDSGEIAGDRGR